MVELSEWDADKGRALLRYARALDSGETPTRGPDSAPIPDYIHVDKSKCRPQLTKDGIAQILAEYLAGGSIHEIATRHARCDTTILNQLRKAGIDTTTSDDRVTITKIRQRQKRLNENEIDQLVADYQAGASTYQLAAKFGCHRSTISSHLKARSVQIRG